MGLLPIAGCACAEYVGNVFSRHRLHRRPLVSDPGMHHDTCVTHVPWCMSGSLTRGGRENVPGIPGACATRNLTYLARGPFKYSFVSYTHISPGCLTGTGPIRDDVIKWKHFSRYWPFVRKSTGHRWIPLAKASEAELWCFFFICAWTHGWVNSRDAGDLKRNCAHYDVNVMCVFTPKCQYSSPERHS